MSTIKVDTYLTRGGASEIAIDKLKGASSAGSMLVVGEGGTNTTNLQQGLIKSWVNFEQDGTHATRDSFNISGLTDEAAGKTHPISFTTNMSSVNYSGSMYSNAYVDSSLGHNSFNNAYAGGFGSRTTSGHSIVSYGSAAVDADMVQVASWGDLA
jgi:hypothetical protein